MRFGSQSQDLTTTLNAELQLSPILPLQSTGLTIDGLSHALKRSMDLAGAKAPAAQPATATAAATKLAGAAE